MFDGNFFGEVLTDNYYYVKSWTYKLTHKITLVPGEMSLKLLIYTCVPPPPHLICVLYFNRLFYLRVFDINRFTKHTVNLKLIIYIQLHVLCCTCTCIPERLLLLCIETHCLRYRNEVFLRAPKQLYNNVNKLNIRNFLIKCL